MTTAAQQHAQRNRGTLFVEDGELIHTLEFPGDQYIMRIRAPKCAAAAQPGTFVHVTCDEALPMRRPLSIMRAGDDWIEVLYKIVGEGLRLLASKQPGDKINVLGPIGQPFRPDPARPNALLVGGGVGIPPMVFLAEALRETAAQPLAILGSEIPFPFEVQSSAIETPWAGDGVVGTITLTGDVDNIIIGGVVGRMAAKYGRRARLYVVLEVGHATQNLCLAACNQGLGTVIVGLFDHDNAGAILKMPENHEVVVLIPLGYPAKQSSPPKRKALAEFVHTNFF